MAKVSTVIGDVEGKVVVMTDDIIDTAGTLVAGADALKEAGAVKVYACATHGLFNGPALERIGDSEIDRLVVTDTVPIDPFTKPDNVEVLSVAGILAEVGSPMTTEASDALIAHVGTIAQHRAKQLTEAMVAAADLVLAATRDIRADIVRSVPSAVRRTFTVREFARLAALMPDDAVPALSGLAAAVAAERVGAPDADDDVADPIGSVGSTGNTTGPHLHLEVRPDGGAPVDPYDWLVGAGLTP